MPFWRRDEETLNERLRREADEAREERHEDVTRDDDVGAGPYAHSIRGQGVFTDRGLVVRAPRDHDAIVVVEASDDPSRRVAFVSMLDGSLVLEDGDARDLPRIAEAVERELPPPYRALAERDGEAWVIAADSLEVVELTSEIDGDIVEIAVTEDRRTVTVDGSVAPRAARELEALGDGRFRTYYLRAARLDGSVWEVEVTPL